MKRILFPTDFSPSAENAFLYALQFANSVKAELVILHAYVIPYNDQEFNSPEERKADTEASREKIKEAFEKHVDELKKTAADQSITIPLSTLFIQNTFLTATEKALKESPFDLIIMGTTGPSGLSKTFRGSNAVDIIHILDVAVLSIPEHATYKKVDHIGFTTTFRDSDITALKTLMPLADALGARIEILHVAKAPSDALEEKKTAWLQKLGNSSTDLHIVYNDNIQAEILEFFGSTNADIVALVKLNKNFFKELFEKSISESLAYSFNTPVLVFHE